MGFLAGVIFKAVSKIDKTKIISFIITAISGAVINTVLFVSMFLLFFRNSTVLGMQLAEMPVVEVIGVLVTVNAILEIIVCGVMGTAISKVISKYVFKSNKNISQKANLED